MIMRMMRLLRAKGLNIELPVRNACMMSAGMARRAPGRIGSHKSWRRWAFRSLGNSDLFFKISFAP